MTFSPVPQPVVSVARASLAVRLLMAEAELLWRIDVRTLVVPVVRICELHAIAVGLTIKEEDR